MMLGHVPEGTMDGFRKADLYLLTDIDIPWTDDGTRYYPDEADRTRFMDICEQVLEEAGARWVRIRGSREARLEQAIAAAAALRPLPSATVLRDVRIDVHHVEEEQAEEDRAHDADRQDSSK